MAARNDTDAMGDICSGKNKGEGVEMLGVGDSNEEFLR